MNKLFVALTVAGLGTILVSIAAQEPSPSPSSISPDKQWQYQWPDGENPVILKAGTTQAVLDLSEEAAPQFASEAKVVWAPDSKRFAFNYRAGSRYNTTALYQLRGDK